MMSFHIQKEGGKVGQNEGSLARQLQVRGVPGLRGPEWSDQDDRDLAMTKSPEQTGNHREGGKGIAPLGRPGLGKSICRPGPWIRQPAEVFRKLVIPTGGKQIQGKGTP